MKEIIGGFSESGRYYAEISVNGKVNVWDTNVGDLRHTYSPSGHLNSSVSCVKWIQMDNTDLLCIGTQKGYVEFYNIASGCVFSKINTQSRAVKSIYRLAQYLYVGSDDGHVMKFDLKTNKLEESKNKMGKICALAVLSDGRVLTASREIKLWNFPSGKLIHKFIGHKNEITSLHIIEADKCYLLSCARDRFVNIWSLSDLKPDPLASLVAEDNISSMFVQNARNNITVTATTECGTLHVYVHVLNGCVVHPLKPQGTLQIAVDTIKDEENVQMPIICSKIIDSRVYAVYGTRPFLAFENIQLSKLNKCTFIARQDPKKSKTVVGSHIINPNISDAKCIELKNNRSSNLPLETRLQNMSEEIETTVQTKGESIVHLLVQGLRSNDKNLLESALFVKDDRTIDNTVSRLPLQSIIMLVHKLIRLSQDRTLISSVSVRWLSAILRIHASLLLANPDVLETFLPLENVLSTRLNNFRQLGLLEFKLKALVNKLNFDKEDKDKEQAALLVYNDSDDEDKKTIDEDALLAPIESEDEDQNTTDEEEEMDIDINGEDYPVLITNKT
ncbi:WD40/YVTN repeat-like-containing domain,Small-subunit processome, Utp12,WD40 repeat,WD40-repeat- [Cinara cedri]|uniref:WD40/YVTN repeat-like-containing domain,Small-subunit processome, Utp12,WD40 repeat,WD40-repeat n=1 Tax=Cinara cedri TaxID=506608 RepID=A0A5E4M8K5_9HEMI|nr:WD40/YVTN repeat-like-containing domain,Small-subunit processome, Utp12,WD40 repeat,WD40-repeat- [Cinara cedri]